MCKIYFSDISVVVSGPIFKNYTKESLTSIRKLMPNSEIVLSSWKSEDVSGLDFDKLVLSEDPGDNSICNINRQIVSRLAGIKLASRKYVLAIRSESVILNTNFLNYFNKFSCFDNQYKFLNSRVVIPAAVPRRCGQIFHMGDWYYFGYKVDLIDCWDLPLQNLSLIPVENQSFIGSPHRHVIVNFVKKHIPLDFNCESDTNLNNIEIYEKVLANNFIIVGIYDFGVASLKYPLKYKFIPRMYHYSVSYTFNEWIKLYNKFSNGDCKYSNVSFMEWFGVNVWSPLRKLGITNYFVKLYYFIHKSYKGYKYY